MLDKTGKPFTPKECVKFDANGNAKNKSGLVFDDYRNWLLVQSWVMDQRAGLSHIFVSRELRARLLRFAKSRKDFRPYADAAAKLLKQPEHASPHDDHFHVRISCPDQQQGLCKGESRR
jgi:penicillin-insensitive murein endopeptidase